MSAIGSLYLECSTLLRFSLVSGTTPIANKTATDSLSGRPIKDPTACSNIQIVRK